jgi:hypothetical protein
MLRWITSGNAVGPFLAGRPRRAGLRALIDFASRCKGEREDGRERAGQ